MFDYCLIDICPALADPAWIGQAGQIAQDLQSEGLRLRSNIQPEPTLFELLDLQRSEAYLLASDTFNRLAGQNYPEKNRNGFEL